MGGIRERLRTVPGWPFVLGWVVAFFAWGFARGTSQAWLAWPVYFAWCLLTLMVLVVFVRWAVRARGWRRVVAIGLGLLIVAFFAQRLVSGSDDYEIERAIETAATSTDPDDCEETQTEAYMAQRTGVTPPYADDACESYAGDANVRDPEVLDIEIDGDTAIAEVAHRDGAFVDSTIRVELVEDDGDWKLNRVLAIPHFDRAAYEGDYADSFLEFGSPRSAADCAVREIRKLSDERIVRTTLAGSIEPYERIVVLCDRPGVERAIVASFADDEYWSELSGSGLDCISERLADAPPAELGVISRDPSGWDGVAVACDREGYLASLAASMDEDGESETVHCVVGELRALDDAELIRRVYDDEAMDDLYEECEG